VIQNRLTDATRRCCYSGHSIKQKDIAMLVLTRRPGESLIIETTAGEKITVTVLEAKGNQVRAGRYSDCPGGTAGI
jgi:hypothetical protein